MEWRAGLCPDAHHILGDEGTPRTLLQVKVGVGVRLVAVGGGNRCARSRTCDLDVPCAVGFTDASVLLEEGEADCTFAECFTESICDFRGGGGGGGVGYVHHRATGWGFLRVPHLADYLTPNTCKGTNNFWIMQIFLHFFLIKVFKKFPRSSVLCYDSRRRAHYCHNIKKNPTFARVFCTFFLPQLSPYFPCIIRKFCYISTILDVAFRRPTRVAAVRVRVMTE